MPVLIALISKWLITSWLNRNDLQGGFSLSQLLLMNLIKTWWDGSLSKLYLSVHTCMCCAHVYRHAIRYTDIQLHEDTIDKYVCVCVCALCLCLSVRLSAFQRACLSICLSVCLSVYLPFNVSVCLSVCLSTYLSVSRYVSLSVCLPVSLSVCHSKPVSYQTAS